MAQLIKLRDYISRYETNPFHYPTQFIRLKQENWRKLVKAWQEENEAELEAERWQVAMQEGASRSFRWNPFRKKEKERSEDAVLFKRHLPSTKDQLRKYFLNQLYPFQLKWATSTLTQVSYTEQDPYFDHQLKYFLQHFPDIYLIMYYPIFNIKKAPVDLDILMISPVEIEIITIVDANDEETIVVDDDRTWRIESEIGERTIISPTISLKRTEHIVESILQTHSLSYNIKKTVLSQDANFLFVTEPYNVSLVGNKEYNEWYQGKRELSGSLKGAQLKVVETLLEYCLSTSVRRPEWGRDEEEESIFIIGD